VSLLFGAFPVFDLRQALLQLNAIHTALPKPLLNESTAVSSKLAAVLRLCQVTFDASLCRL